MTIITSDEGTSYCAQCEVYARRIEKLEAVARAAERMVHDPPPAYFPNSRKNNLRDALAPWVTDQIWSRMNMTRKELVEQIARSYVKGPVAFRIFVAVQLNILVAQAYEECARICDKADAIAAERIRKRKAEVCSIKKGEPMKPKKPRC